MSRRKPLARRGLYLVAKVPGISGFQRWGKIEYHLVPGHLIGTRATRGEILQQINITDTGPLDRGESVKVPDAGITHGLTVGGFIGSFTLSGYHVGIVETERDKADVPTSRPWE